MTFSWPPEVKLERADGHTPQCRCVFLPRQMPEQLRAINAPKRSLTDAPTWRDVAFQFLARGQQ